MTGPSRTRLAVRAGAVALSLAVLAAVAWRIAHPGDDGRAGGSQASGASPAPPPVVVPGQGEPSLREYLSGDVKIGVDGTYPGWSKADGPALTGFDAALIEYLRGKYHFNPVYVQLTPDERDHAVPGRVKLVVANYSMTTERDKFVDFAGPYFHDRSGILCSPRKMDCGKPIQQSSICVATGTVMAGKLPGAQQRGELADCMKAFYDQDDPTIGAISTDAAILEAYGATVGSVGSVSWTDQVAHPISDELYGIGLLDNSPRMCLDLDADIDAFLADKAAGWDAAFSRNLGKLDPFSRKPEKSDRSWCHADGASRS